MNEDLAAEIARMEAELARDDQIRQMHGEQRKFGVTGQDSFSPFAQQLPPHHPYQPPHPQFSTGQVNSSTALPATGSLQHSFPESFNSQQIPPGQAHEPQQAPSQQNTSHVFSKDSDGRSVFVGNLPKGENGGPTTTPEELAQFFSDCGQILNCTVLKDRFTQELKGTAYIEFASYSSMGQAIDTKNNTQFKGNTIIVTRKRSNFKPGKVRGRGGAGRSGRMPDPYQAIAALMGMMAGGAAAASAGGHRGGRGRGRGGSSGFQPF